MSRARAAALAFGVAVAAAAPFAACSLGLDPSLLNPKPEAGPPLDAPAADVPPPPPSEAGVGCKTNADCVNPNKCTTGTCDPNLHVCSFALCLQTTPCMAAACTAGACGTARKVPFLASTVHLGNPLGACATPDMCIGAVFPYLVVAEAGGVVAYMVANPLNGAPPGIPVNGLGFAPVEVRVAGSRVFFLGSLIQSSPSNKLPVAWVDIPDDPTLASLTATSVQELATSGAGKQTLAGPSGSLFLQESDNGFFTVLTPPLVDGASLNFYPLNGMTSSIVATSGARMVGGRWDSGALAWQLQLEDKAGTASATNLGDQNATMAMGPVAGQAHFTQGDDGSVLLQAGAVAVDPEAGPLGVSSSRLAWVLSDDKATQFDSTAHVDLETYGTMVGMDETVSGPMAWVSGGSALALALAAETFNADGAVNRTASVQVVTKSGSTASLAPNARDTFPLFDANWANGPWVWASGGYAYVATSTPLDGGASLDVRLYAPGCGP